MTYTAFCYPLPLGMFLCEIFDRQSDLALTLTTEAMNSEVAAYYGDIVVSRSVDCLTDTYDVIMSFRLIIDSLDLPPSLKTIAHIQLQKEFCRRIWSPDPFSLLPPQEQKRNMEAEDEYDVTYPLRARSMARK